MAKTEKFALAPGKLFIRRALRQKNVYINLQSLIDKITKFNILALAIRRKIVIKSHSQILEIKHKPVD